MGPSTVDDQSIGGGTSHLLAKTRASRVCVTHMPAQQADSVWTPALAGAFSGFVTRLVTGPLDTLKIRNQLHWQHGKDPNPSLLTLVRGIVAEEGVLALWKGTVPGMCLWMSYSFVQFGVFDALQSSTALRRLDEHFPAALLSGAVAGKSRRRRRRRDRAAHVACCSFDGDPRDVSL